MFSKIFEDILHNYDFVLDTVGGEIYRKSFQVLRKGKGFIVSMLKHPDVHLMKNYDATSIFQFTKVNREHLTQLTEWIPTIVTIPNHIKRSLFHPINA